MTSITVREPQSCYMGNKI